VLTNIADHPASMIGRVSRVLDGFTQGRQELRVSEIVRCSGLPKATASRIVAELVEHGFLERSGPAVRLGLRFFELGEQTARPHELRQLAMAHMSDLRSATRHTVHLAVLDGAEVVYVAILRSRTAPMTGSRIGGRLPAHATAVGKALLASAPWSAIETAVGAGLQRVGPHTITESDELRCELAGIRERGVSFEHEESGPGVACVAAPIQVHGGAAVAALSVSFRAGDSDPELLAMAVRTTAIALGREATRTPSFNRIHRNNPPETA
jgi:IclR family transcriptional regulator, acetate operon repressor